MFQVNIIPTGSNPTIDIIVFMENPRFRCTIVQLYCLVLNKCMIRQESCLGQAIPAPNAWSGKNHASGKLALLQMHDPARIMPATLQEL